jgi:hypothetical protein
MENIQTNPYKTSDLYFAAFLKVAGVKFVEAVREGDRIVYIFEDAEGLRDLKNSYFNRTGKVVAMNYADEVKAMKALIHMTR